MIITVRRLGRQPCWSEPWTGFSARTVTDDGQAAAPAGQHGPARGRGLIGIRERAALHGGTCEAGLRPDGGFGVRASFPLPGDGPS